MRRGLLIAGALVAIACSAPTSASLETAIANAEGDDPLLVVSRLCYAMCPSWNTRPIGAVYPGGEILFLANMGSNHPRPLELRRLLQDEDQLALVTNLAEIGRLNEPGNRVVGSRDGIADGGATIFDSVLGGEPTYVHAPHPGSDPSDPVRDALWKLNRFFGDLYLESSSELVPGPWILIGYPDELFPGVAWPGPGVLEGQLDCLEFEKEEIAMAKLHELEISDRLYFSFPDGTYVAFARPLLPHEEGCDEVIGRLHKQLEIDATLDLGEAAG